MTVFDESPLFSFGLFADCQYSDIPSTHSRNFKASKEKLSEIISMFNKENLTFIVNFGDIINDNIENYDPILTEIQKSRHPIYHLLGNHDFNVDDIHKSKIPNKLGLIHNYSSVTIQNWRFILLDGTELSPDAHPKSSQAYQNAIQYKKDHHIHSPNWNGAITVPQLLWLENQLKDAELNRENTLIFCHFPIYPKNIHNLWNATEIKKLIRQYACVKGFIAGHNHRGNFGVLRGNWFKKIPIIPCITLKGMVDTLENVYYICRLYSNRFLLEGFGRETFIGFKNCYEFRFLKK